MYTYIFLYMTVLPTDIVVYFKEWWNYKDIDYQIFVSTSYKTFVWTGVKIFTILRIKHKIIIMIDSEGKLVKIQFYIDLH